MQSNSYSQEIVTIVDKENNVIGYLPRPEMSAKRLIHRTSYILLIDEHTRDFYIQLRSRDKRYCPGYWDLWFGGCVQKDETYEENAVRELKEEAGVQATNQELHHLFDFYFENERTKSWGRCYYHLFEGTLKDLEPGGDEVELIKLVSRDEILGMIQAGENITPDGLIAFNRFLEEFYPKLRR